MLTARRLRSDSRRGARGGLQRSVPSRNIKLTDLPPELLINIFRRLGKQTLSAVCKKFQRLYHEHATSVTLTRPYTLNQDDDVVDTINACGSLKRVIVRSAAGPGNTWHWPTRFLVRIQCLFIPHGWTVGEIPTTLRELTVRSCLRDRIDFAWCDRVIARLDSTQSECVVIVNRLAMRSSVGEWAGLSSARIRLKSIRCGRLCVAEQALDAHAAHLRHAEFSALDIINARFLDSKNLSCLTNLDLQLCKRLESIEGLTGAHLLQLKRLGIFQCDILNSIAGFAGAGLSHLTELQLSECGALTSLQGLADAGLSQLASLKIQGCKALKSLDGLAGLVLSQLTDLDLRHCSSLTSLQAFHDTRLPRLQQINLLGDAELESIEGLGPMPQLTSLMLVNCRALSTLQPLAGGNVSKLRMLDLTGCDQLVWRLGPVKDGLRVVTRHIPEGSDTEDEEEEELVM